MEVVHFHEESFPDQCVQVYVSRELNVRKKSDTVRTSLHILSLQHTEEQDLR